MDGRYLKTLSGSLRTMTDKIVKVYYPLPRFPPISFSRQCGLSCLHCQGRYLSSMTKVTEPQDLYHFAQTLFQRGGTGFLASGGFTPQGTLMNLEDMLPILACIKEETSLVVALHTGFIDRHTAQKIKKTQIDVACPQIIGDRISIEEIMGVSVSPQTFAQTLQNLDQAGVALAPHICAGLYWGRLQGEKEALALIKESCLPETVVITTLCPTPGTPMESSPVLSPGHLSDVIKWAHTLFPQVDITLGCMRPRQRSLEIQALHAGITRIANPSKSFLDYAQKKGYQIQVYAACCSIPASCERATWMTVPDGIPCKTQKNML